MGFITFALLSIAFMFSSGIVFLPPSEKSLVFIALRYLLEIQPASFSYILSSASSKIGLTPAERAGSMSYLDAVRPAAFGMATDRIAADVRLCF